jgi:hypothetical protein
LNIFHQVKENEISNIHKLFGQMLADGLLIFLELGQGLKKFFLPICILKAKLCFEGSLLAANNESIS